jgi:hypothetical protein
MAVDFGTILTGLAGIIIAVGGVMAQMGRKSTVDTRRVTEENRRVNHVNDVMRRDNRVLRSMLIDAGVEPPPRPPEMEPGWGLGDDGADADKKQVTQ